MILGITGGSGCGKTTMLRHIENLGGLVLDCDAIYHNLLKTDADMLMEISRRFPGTVESGSLDRKKLGKIVFADARALADLNAITHAAVKREVLSALASQPRLAAIDAIGLFEGQLAPLCDATIAILAPKEDRIQRLMLRDNIPREYAASRIHAQHTDEWFRSHCDYTLVNDTDLSNFSNLCLDFLASLGIMDNCCQGE